MCWKRIKAWFGAKEAPPQVPAVEPVSPPALLGEEHHAAEDVEELQRMLSPIPALDRNATPRRREAAPRRARKKAAPARLPTMKRKSPSRKRR